MTKKQKRIRPLAICVFRKNDQILVAKGYDSVKDEYFYRPLGGGIEFGEQAVETICRELMEEIKVEVARESLKLLGAVENIFTFLGKAHHEIVLIYDGALKEPGLYGQDVIIGQEANGEEVRAAWKDLEEFASGQSILYPTGLLELLQK
jgi:8-oxo-dGTP pyrophosphatase MutT (NUDIX family)